MVTKKLSFKLSPPKIQTKFIHICISTYKYLNETWSKFSLLAQEEYYHPISTPPPKPHIRMETTISKPLKHDSNKENMAIPPSLTKEANVLVLENAKKTLPIVKKRFRRPLQDITHLFINSQPVVRLSSAAFLTESFISPVAASAVNCRKRKADGDEIDSMEKNASKILRKEFR